MLAKKVPNTRSIVIILLVSATVYLAIIDKEFRATFGHIADVGLGGYLGQLLPKE